MEAAAGYKVKGPDTNLSLDPVELGLLVIPPGHPPGPLPGTVELRGEGFAEGDDDK